MNRVGDKPGTVWYFAAAALAIAGCIAGVLMIWQAVTLMTDVKQFIAPSRTAMEVATPGDYLIWHNYHAVFQGHTYSVAKALPDGVSFRVMGPDGALPVSGSSGTTSKIGETRSVAVASFSASRVGHYEIAIEGDFPARVFAVGPNGLTRAFIMMFAGVFAILLGFIGGIGLAAWTYYKRSESNNKKGEMTMDVLEGDSDHAKKQLATLVYALQALSFLVGITFIAGIIVNYLKRGEVAGTWLESHFDWQIRTFWWSLLWGAIGFVLTVVVIGIFILIADALWVLYRIIKGWLNLNDGKAMYQ